jgi:endonuclease YncB( thermonuclease family)
MRRKPSKLIAVAASRRAPRFGALFIFCLGIFSQYLVSAVAHAACALDHRDEQAPLARIVDGDTIVLDDGRKVRLIGVNTPETRKPDHPAEPLAEAAKALVQSLLPVGGVVQLRFDHTATDRHGRTLAHVYTPDGRNVGEELVAHGLAMAIAVPPNLWQHTCYVATEKKARDSKRGLWQLSFYAPTAVQPRVHFQQRFQLITGEVTSVQWTAKGARLELNDTLSVRITRHDLRYFSRTELQRLKGQNVIVRGWLRQERGKWTMQLRHPSMLREPEK